MVHPPDLTEGGSIEINTVVQVDWMSLGGTWMDVDEVKRVGRLARLELTDEEAVSMVDELNDILEYLEMLDTAPDVDVYGFNPIPVEDVLREDEPKVDIDPEVLRGMLDTHEGWVRGPRLS